MYQNPYMNQFNFPGQFPNPYQNQFPGLRQNQFITKQVSNVEEAKACLIDPLSTYLFVDMNQGKIYLKRMNDNGLSDFYTFTVEDSPESKIDPFQSINQRLENIENILGGNKNDKSVSNVSKFAESLPNGFSTTEKSESGIIPEDSADDDWKIGRRNQNNGSKHRQ